MSDGDLPVLRMESVRRTFGGSAVLRDVGIEVLPHTVTALIGASGSGKSTLLRCANLLEDIDDGAIWLDGEEITDPRVDQDAVRRRIGVVFFKCLPGCCRPLRARGDRGAGAGRRAVPDGGWAARAQERACHCLAHRAQADHSGGVGGEVLRFVHTSVLEGRQ